MQYMTLQFNPLDISVDLPLSVDPIEQAAGSQEAEAYERMLQDLEDEVIDTIGNFLTHVIGVDVTVRVRQPVVPRTPLIAAFHTEPF